MWNKLLQLLDSNMPSIAPEPGSKIKHLEFIQATINRMASNSANLKKWAVTLIAALLALGTKESSFSLNWISAGALIVFWFIDSYYLALERCYRDLFDDVRKLPEYRVDFKMSVKLGIGKWLSALFSVTSLYYLCLAGLIVAVAIWINQ